MENGTGDGSDPSGFLTEIIGSHVKVKLNSGVEYTGIVEPSRSEYSTLTRLPLGLLSSIDGYMNLAMERTKEYVSEVLRKDYGDCFIRGNNGALVPSSFPSPKF